MSTAMAITAMTAGVRPGRLVDVPAVVRLLVPGPPSDDEDQARRALRLLLAHHLLEEGQLWVAEGGLGDTRVAAAAIWLPPGARPPGERVARVLARELRHPVDVIAAGMGARAALAAARPGERHWTLTTAGMLGPDWDERRARGLLAPGFAAADRDAASVLAITTTERDARRLGGLGFVGARHVTTAHGPGAWLARRPAAGRGVAARG
ncbi:hypothetical protein [Streptomyces hainanensis]|uniref:Uncharacterized protein n=1 Tax=Streptomyces hainanensis TaxID=402648 RepID=A0A4R4SQ20_9ACTN|nr:hypothetical protein [Streptomyces hainanensis]TDC64269.1 hypothetical protein E1283_31670 [Streptomyces hainanensis]